MHFEVTETTHKESQGRAEVMQFEVLRTMCKKAKGRGKKGWRVRAQGCMNNLTFGDSGMGYYETIAGGAGAGPGWHGRSGVHTHMTNTRITDPEILERRYPVVLHQFSLRPGSGGAGHWRGGDGVVREVHGSLCHHAVKLSCWCRQMF